MLVTSPWGSLLWVTSDLPAIGEGLTDLAAGSTLDDRSQFGAPPASRSRADAAAAAAAAGSSARRRRARRAADDELWRRRLERRRRGPIDLGEQLRSGGFAEAGVIDAHGRQRRGAQGRHGRVVEAHDRDVARDEELELAGNAGTRQREHVARVDERRRASVRLQQAPRGGQPGGVLR